jgi:hypothetical protein
MGAIKQIPSNTFGFLAAKKAIGVLIGEMPVFEYQDPILVVPVPTIFLSAKSDTEIDVFITHDESYGATIEVEASDDGVSYISLTTFSFVNGAEYEYNDTGLTAATPYWYRARALVDGVYSDWVVATKTTQGLVTELTVQITESGNNVTSV